MEAKSQVKVFLAVYLIIAALSLLFLDNVLAFDSDVAAYMAGYSNVFLDMLFSIITYAGTILFWVLIIGLFWLYKDEKIVSLLMAGLAIEIVLSGVLKLGFNRPRPLGALDALPSFPSSHTTRAFMGASIIKNYRIIFIVLAILVAFSRIYLGVHYPSDVLFGALNGIGIAILVRYIPYKKLDKKIKKLYTKK